MKALSEEKRNIMNNRNNSIFVPDGKNAIHDGIEHEPSGGKALLDPTDTLFLLLDHQSGLFQNVKDISVAELRANTTALAKLATLHQIPVITTALHDGISQLSRCDGELSKSAISGLLENIRSDDGCASFYLLNVIRLSKTLNSSYIQFGFPNNSKRALSLKVNNFFGS